MHELNVNTLCSVTLLALCGHHLSEKKVFGFDVAVSTVVADSMNYDKKRKAA